MRTIQELEADVGASLMMRSVRGIELTEYGNSLLIRATQILEDGQRALEEIAQMKGEMVGRVSFGMTSSIAMTLLAPTLKQFRKLAPRAHVTVVEEKFPTAAHRLRDGSIDFIGTHVLPTMLDDDMETVPLLTTDFVVMAREGHPLAGARSLAELQDAEWFQPVPHEGSRSSVLAAAFAALGLPMAKRIVHCDSFVISLALTADTDVIGLFSRPLAQRVAKFGLREIVFDTPMPPLQMSAVMRRHSPLTPLAKRFLGCLQEAGNALSESLKQN
jgi:DNA-binding transcriptional LysR family regulator